MFRRTFMSLIVAAVSLATFLTDACGGPGQCDLTRSCCEAATHGARSSYKLPTSSSTSISVVEEPSPYEELEHRGYTKFFPFNCLYAGARQEYGGVVAFRPRAQGSSTRGRGDILIAYHGTNSLATALTDFDFFKDSLDSTIFNGHEGLAHSGFVKAHKSSVEQVQSLIDEIIGSNSLTKSDVRFIVTGHSLGGALASLEAYRLACNASEEERKNIYILTYGSPRVFVKETAADFTQKVGKNTVRVWGITDLVPAVLFGWLGYKHVGMEIPIQHDGYCIKDAHSMRTYGKAVADSLDGILDTVNTHRFLADLEDFERTFLENLNDLFNGGLLTEEGVARQLRRFRTFYADHFEKAAELQKKTRAQTFLNGTVGILVTVGKTVGNFVWGLIPRWRSQTSNPVECVEA